jgi:L-amino acid N-acyltransferase YncA
LKFEQEQLSDGLIEEMMPLINAHWEEIAHDKDIPLDPDWYKYGQLQTLGSLKVFTARDDDGQILGYSFFFVSPNLHYKSSLQAVQDVIYIDKERRGFGRKFIDWCDSELRQMGVQKVYHHVKAKHNFGPMLETLDYHLVDLIYARRLDEVE